MRVLLGIYICSPDGIFDSVDMWRCRTSTPHDRHIIVVVGGVQSPPLWRAEVMDYIDRMKITPDDREFILGALPRTINA